MKTHSRRFNFRYFILTAPIFLTSCVGGENIHSENPKIPLTSGPEFYAISFKPGQPSGRDGLFDAVADRSAALKAMTHNAELIKSIKSAQFTIVGTTDNIECSVKFCEKLSSDRARLVHGWLVAHGVPASNLTRPVGRGSAMPAGYESNEEERFMNRSVQVVID